MIRHNTKKIISVCLLLILALVSLTACSNTLTKGASNDPVVLLAQTGTIIGNTLDNSAKIVVTQLTATINEQDANNMFINGTYELTNVSTASLSVEVINFGVLDKQMDARYWGSTSINEAGEVAPNQTVRGMFTILVPRTINLKECDLIFGRLPDINFQEPLVP